MAPDSRLWRHQLGGAPINGRRRLLNAVIPIFFLLTALTTEIQARTEPAADSWSKLSASFLLHERSTSPEVRQVLFLSPPFAKFHFSPAFPVGQSSNRNQIHIPDHPSIQKYVRLYKGEQRQTFLKALERSWSYAAIMAEILESHGVPAEMAYIPLVESRFKGKASYKGAVGHWQLLAGTARSLGLRVDRWVDERNDPIKSTHAAARYLRSFYERFNSWPLALAAYNAGDRPVVNAMKKYRTDNYWELAKRGSLPGRTSTYVAKIYAAIRIIRDLENHGFDRPGDYRLYDFESIWVGSPLRLDQVAKWLDVPVNHMQDLNPSLRLDQVPPNTDFDLRLPPGARDKFDIAYDGYLGK